MSYRVTTLSIALATSLASVVIGQDTKSEAVQKLQTKLQENPDDSDTTLKACASDDIDTVPLCHGVFESAKKQTKNVAAVHMIRRGFREEPYVSFC
jgi:hypothetical protein